jgi:WXG100 family type VII secretion target
VTTPLVQTSEPGMQAAATEFSSRATEFTGSLRNINGSMGALQVAWSGAASNQFNQAMDNWENAFQKVINELMTMMETMGVTTSGYRQSEEDASQVARSFGAALPGV